MRCFVILPPVSQSYLLKAHFLLRAGGRAFTPRCSHTLFPFEERQVNCLSLFCPQIVGAGFQPAASNSLSVICLGKIYSADIECLELKVTAEALRPNCLWPY